MSGNRIRWHWLLWVPIAVPLIIPFYNRLEPRLYGVPFFYWGQMSFVLLEILVITLVFQATKRRG